MNINVGVCDRQGHPEGPPRGQGEAEADAEEPASLLLRTAPGAGGGAPLDEEGGAACCHQREGQLTAHSRGFHAFIRTSAGSACTSKVLTPLIDIRSIIS